MPLESRVAVRSSQRSAASFAPREQNRSPVLTLREDRGVRARKPPSFPPVERPAPPRPMPIRLRYVALLVGAGLSLRSLGLGALAFWQLHTAAAQLANYAACMAGP